MQNTKQKLAVLGVLLSFVVSAADAATLGPVYPAPGGNTFSSSGNVGLAGGGTATYSGFDFNAFDQLWWGPADVGSAMDGTIDAASEWMSLSSMSGNVAIWTGSTTVNTLSGPATVYTRFTATITSGAPGGWITPGSVGISTSGLNAVAEITGSPFVVNRLFEASFTSGSGYSPFLTFFDANTGASEVGKAKTNFNGQMYYTNPVPIPASVWLFGSGILGLIGIARRRKSV